MYSLIIIKNIYNIQIYPNSSISKIKELIFITKKFSHFKLETYHYTKKQKVHDIYSLIIIKELIFITKKFSHFKLETYHYINK